MKLRVQCPAKLNLFLAVGESDQRGYHPVRTIMQSISLFDEIEVEFGPGPVNIEIENAELPPENTITKTLRLSRELFARHPSRIRLVKRIPTESGLGGGSSDAAGLLRAMAFANGQPDSAELRGIASAVGMDVPFFLTGGRARGEGYGEVITLLPDQAVDWFVVAKPAMGCSSADMYRRLDAVPREWRAWPSDDRPYNDFERVAPPECMNLIGRLSALGARDAGLSGSGSAVFGRFSNRETAEAASTVVERAEVFVAHSLSRAESLRIEQI